MGKQRQKQLERTANKRREGPTWKLQRYSDDVINIHQFQLEWQLQLFCQLCSLASSSLRLLPPLCAHGGEGEGDPVWGLLATKGSPPSVHAPIQEPIKSPLKGVQGAQLSSWVFEKWVGIFLQISLHPTKNVGVYMWANLTKHVWVSLQRNSFLGYDAS